VSSKKFRLFFFLQRQGKARVGVSPSGLKLPAGYQEGSGYQEGFGASPRARTLPAVEYSNAKSFRVFHSKAARVALEYWGAEKAFEFSRFSGGVVEFRLCLL